MRNKLSRRKDRRIFKRTLVKKDTRNFMSTKRGGQCL